MIDRPVADAAFALKEGEVSAPMQGRFGSVLLRVLKIEPEQVRSFQDVAGELKQELATARAKSEVLKLYDKIEDARSEGKTLAEAAESLKLPASTIPAIDRSGRDPNGTPVQLPDQQRLLEAAFTAEVGVERDPLQAQDGYIWYDVVGITPSRERALDEVKEQVEQRWREQELATRLNAKAYEILDKMKAGSTLAEAAAADQLKHGDLERSQAGRSLGAALGGSLSMRSSARPRTASAKRMRRSAGADRLSRHRHLVPALDAQSDEFQAHGEALNRALADDVPANTLASWRARSASTSIRSALEPGDQRRSRHPRLN